MDRNLALECVRVTEAAALSAAKWVGKGNDEEADRAAVNAMRLSLADLRIRGRVVIGEGERDEAPMLFIGEEVGNGYGPEVDIAVDPLEGTTITAQGRYNALAVIAIANKGEFLNAPDTYMEKLAVGPQAKGAIDLTKTPTENLKNIAKAKRVSVQDLTVIILERDRHNDLIKEVREAGARIRLIQDGDISAALATCWPDRGVDVLMGTGGAPEGVLAAAALRCIGGDMQGRLVFRKEEEKERAKAMGIRELQKIYRIHELAGGDVMFAATGVTNGDFLKGVRFFPGGAETHSVVMRSTTGTIRYLEATHNFNVKPPTF
ncbi:MAG: fructose-bisphosphatase, class II [Deltaproteobacteria bacterium RIFCSPLOWO2_12_FULL_44_12]|nr:MAG: fructose-bisphosphatase, class II [Deltaproteobacteria bacterium RIFCSPHIGHO2_01_FULL_43_49]OGQ15431.1 MAG: fructose-bisphosphatase, class II [Deltaproteobacteria bacterium RIFCSPHIGHO2_02_FULL_44_53]OGQ29624.1 MAG: fructose-bisphosphatase, class II [Deltaproteobacteria bacterium RIFCSPHIGHO2_12_FULL_44_21]OGQ32237.1 MAG: fructose-bisphosphatase, class II [Deltaproteobacteria bacterium RIFCSPLOWO2_01_FULL_45_74]OGQ43879.1 MAG: fructose-bisphosphatase, class II [Deltaproteobacteria bacte